MSIANLTMRYARTARTLEVAILSNTMRIHSGRFAVLFVRTVRTIEIVITTPFVRYAFAGLTAKTIAFGLCSTVFLVVSIWAIGMRIAKPLVRQAYIYTWTTKFTVLTFQMFVFVFAIVALLIGTIRTIGLTIAQEQERNAITVTTVEVG